MLDKGAAASFRPSGDGAVSAEIVEGYGPTAKSLHWLIVALVAVQFVVSWLMPDIGRNTPPSALINLHFSLGVLILVVMAVRLVHRLYQPVPLLASESPRWERWAAELLHRLFYLLLLVGPFLGWASASAHNLPVTVFGLFTLPDIAAPKARWGSHRRRYPQAGDVDTARPHRPPHRRRALSSLRPSRSRPATDAG